MTANKSSNIPLTVGLVLGPIGIILLVVSTLLWFRYRTRSRTIAFERNMTRTYQHPPHLDSDHSNQHSVPAPLQQVSQLPPPPDTQSVLSSGSFSVTSPIAARQRDAWRNRTNDLSNFRLSMSTASHSASGASRSTASNFTSFPVPALPPRTRTNRQRLTEEKIQLLQSEILFLHSRKPNMSPSEFAEELKSTEQRVERLKQIHESDWALELTDVAPEGLHD